MANQNAPAPSPRRYPRAPITEAIIDLSFEEPVERTICERIKKRLGDEYPFENEWNEGDLLFNPVTAATEYKRTRSGFRLASLDQTEVVIVADRRFAVSRLAPYMGWEPFRERAAKNWKVVKDVVGYKKISRIGVRYINRLDLPLREDKRVDSSDYLNFHLQVPQPPFTPIEQQMTQAVFRSDGLTIIVNTGTVPSPLVNHGSIALDIDIGRETDVPQNDEEIFSYLDRVRALKNTLFEACITDRARELFSQ